jgi:ParB-like chromosome segregation protein Spo0J
MAESGNVAPEGWEPGRFLEPSRWAAMTAELRPIADLMPYAGNPMDHGAAQIALLRKSMRRFGVTMPALMDDGGTLIAGHGRILAAAEEGATLYPVAVALGWSEEEVKAYRLLDNQLARLGTWNEERTAAELRDLRAVAWPLDDLGFAPHELDLYLGDFDGPQDPDELWRGMPEFKHEDLTSACKAIVHFRSEADKAEFEKLIGQRIPSATKAVWWPAEERGRHRDQVYVAEE